MQLGLERRDGQQKTGHRVVRSGPEENRSKVWLRKCRGPGYDWNGTARDDLPEKVPCSRGPKAVRASAKAGGGNSERMESAERGSWLLQGRPALQGHGKPRAVCPKGMEMTAELQAQLPED